MDLNLSDNLIYKEKSKQFIIIINLKINKYLSLIYQLFKQQTHNKVLQSVNLLKRESVNFPNF